jgi:RNA polymerase sigma-70 factor (ECF subfamily)
MTGEAFAKAVTEMTQTLYRVSCSQLPNEADREDAVQEALRRAWEKRGSLRNEEYLRTWVVRILLNVCHDIQREGKRMIPAEEIPGPDVPSAEEPVDLKECLLRLDERERIPILLYYLEGFDIGQIAAVLRIPRGTVKSRLHRGRDRLRTICREEVFE